MVTSQNFYIEKLLFPKGWWVLSAKKAGAVDVVGAVQPITAVSSQKDEERFLIFLERYDDGLQKHNRCYGYADSNLENDDLPEHAEETRRRWMYAVFGVRTGVQIAPAPPNSPIFYQNGFISG